MRRNSGVDTGGLPGHINGHPLHDGGHIPVLLSRSGNGQAATGQSGRRQCPQGVDAALPGRGAGDLIIIPEDGGVVGPIRGGGRRSASAAGRGIAAVISSGFSGLAGPVAHAALVDGASLPAQPVVPARLAVHLFGVREQHLAPPGRPGVRVQVLFQLHVAPLDCLAGLAQLAAYMLIGLRRLRRGIIAHVGSVHAGHYRFFDGPQLQS